MDATHKSMNEDEYGSRSMSLVSHTTEGAEKCHS